MNVLIRDHFKRGKHQHVILPFTVPHRVDCVLGPTRTKVREVNPKLQAKGLQNRDPQLRKASGYAFYKLQPPRSLEEIEGDIRAIEKEILGMLGVAAQ
ncbi:MAG: hypothetical protein HY721_04455 [Planctomycetes bacterium]|nr:hypothetical protein [Planctomycetota bacterium]